MATIIVKVIRRLAELGAWLTTLGALGLFLISFLDSALVPLPSGPDIVLIALSAAEPSWMPVYALAAAAGSTLGCTALYLMSRRAGTRALKRLEPARRGRIENLLGRYDMLAVLVPALLPPPFPLKAFVLSAGVFKFKSSRFVLAIFLGRAARYLIEGWLAIEFGREAWQLIRQNGLLVLLALVLASATWLAVAVWRRRRSADLRTEATRERFDNV